MMKNPMKMWMGWDLTVVGLVLGLVGCDRLMAKDALLALEIKQAQVLSGGDCSVPGDPTNNHRTSGTIDLALPDGSMPPYLLPLVVGNNLTAVGGTAADEMNNITLTHFTVELSSATIRFNSGCPATFDTETFSFLLAPGATTGAAIYAVTPAHSACVASQMTSDYVVVTAKVWAKGRHGGTSIESAPFVFPIQFCRGCLQQGYTDVSLVYYNYPADYPLCASLTGTNTYSGDQCLPPGQDEIIRVAASKPASAVSSKPEPSAPASSPAGPRPLQPPPPSSRGRRPGLTPREPSD
jgi:hypothetical protein